MSLFMDFPTRLSMFVCFVFVVVDWFIGMVVCVLVFKVVVVGFVCF